MAVSLTKAFQGIKKYFSLTRAAEAPETDFNYLVQGKVTKPATIGQHLRNYFDLYSQYRVSHQLTREIISIIDGSENFKEAQVKWEKDGVCLVKCSTPFAEKIKQLPSVVSVTEIAPKTVPAPQSPAQ